MIIIKMQYLYPTLFYGLNLMADEFKCGLNITQNIKKSYKITPYTYAKTGIDCRLKSSNKIYRYIFNSSLFFSIFFIYQVLRLRKMNLGAPFLAIDFSTECSLSEDNRVHELHKITYPDFCKEYVLWRVNHDGSCWNSVGITLLLCEMIEGGEEIFGRAVEHFKNILARAHLNKKQQKIIRIFL